MINQDRIDGNWKALKDLVRTVIVGEEDYQRHLEMLDYFEGNVSEDKADGSVTVMWGFKEAPAAKGNHHNFRGGLVHHLLEMWSFWEKVRPMTEFEDYITDERVLKAIIYHDLHKAYRTFGTPSTEVNISDLEAWAVTYVNDPTDMLMSSDIKSIWMLSMHGIHLDPEQMNALLNAEGGYAKVKTKWVSSLSKLCYTLDELSGNVKARVEKRTVLDLRNAEPLKTNPEPSNA